jgi:F420-non-reducing hydrogenase iron-sulfur subunit
MSDEFKPLVLIFSTSTVSDPGIDFAGSSHLDYPSSTAILRLPCSSMIRPEFVLHALKNGFDGVYVAADGPDCPYLSEECVNRTARRVDAVQGILKEMGLEPERIKMAGICSVCGEAFVKSVKDFHEVLNRLGPIKFKVSRE